MRTVDGGSYIGLQLSGVGIKQTITRLDADKIYTLTFLTAERDEQQSFEAHTERLSVKINNKYIVKELNPSPSFQSYTYHFSPNEDGVAELE